MKIDNPTDPAVQKFFGGDIIINIPYLKELLNPGSFVSWIISVIIILPWVVSIVCIFVILINAIKWVKSSGNEKEVESAKIGIKRALVGFTSMFIIFIISNIISFIILGVNLDRVAVALSPCIYISSTRVVTARQYTVLEYSRANNITLPYAIVLCGY